MEVNIDPFKHFIKFGVNFPKKNVVFPKHWQNLTKSIYNNEANFAILTGKINDIIVVDLDLKGSEKSIIWFENIFGKISDINTLVTKSVNGGYHIFFKYNHLIKNKSLVDFNVDILSDRRCCFCGTGYDVINNHEIVELTETQITQILYYTQNNTQNTKKEEPKSISERDLSEILDGLSAERYNNRDCWLRVGYVLSKYPFGERLFLDFSKRSDLFNAERHSIDWRSLKQNEQDDTDSVTIGTLLYWLKIDNPKLHNELAVRKSVLDELDKVVVNSDRVNAFDITHTELIKQSKTSIEALINHNLTITDFHNIQSPKCRRIQLYTHCTISGIKFKCSNCIFEYPPEIIPIDKHIAPNIFNTLVINEDVNNKDTSQIAKLIKDKVKLIYVPKQWYLYNEKTGIYERKRREDIIELIDNMFEDDSEWGKWTNKISYKKTLLEELEVKCIIPEDTELDNKWNLIGFRNGVYDLESGTFRIGHVDEYVSMRCNYNYDENFDTTLANEILSSTFPDKTERDYAINRFCICLEGKNREQTMTFNYGFTASNGKSFLMERINNAMGDYGNTFPVNLLTNKMRGAGEANSTLIGFKNKRFMYSSEPEAGSKLNTNFVKILTGDTIKARGLYSNEEESIKPTYNIFVCCNELPAFDTHDEGISRRIRILDYKTKFCDEPKRKNEKKIILYSDEELCNIESGLLHIFIQRYNNLKSNDFKYIEPELFSNIKNLYINDSKDVLYNIIRENFEIGSDTDFLKLKDIKQILKDNGIDKNIVSIKYIIQDIFPESEFYDRKMINYKPYKSVVSNIKYTNI